MLSACAKHHAVVTSPDSGSGSLIDGSTSPDASTSPGGGLWYLSQSVCADSSDVAQPADPESCPAGTAARPLKLGEKLPYFKHDQIQQQRHDAYPIVTLNGPTAGQTLYVNPFIFNKTSAVQPDYSQFGVWSGDGYDLYEIQDGLVSAGETRDGGGFSQVICGLSGGNADPFNGWVFFPQSFLSASSGGSSASSSIYINYWELAGVPWSTPCSSTASSYGQPIDSWSYIPAFQFGGSEASSLKTIDTIRSIVGYYPSLPNSGHLEVFYFTKPYAITRWEVWEPVSESPAPVPEMGMCSGPTFQTYMNNSYVVTACRDWSAITLEDPPLAPPVTPLADLNLVGDFHFDQGDATFLQDWNRSGSGSAGIINWSLAESQHALDVIGGTGGVRYLAINCDGSCNPAMPEQVYQDIPVSKFATGQTYAYGATARSETTANQQVLFSLLQVDANHDPVAGAAVAQFIATVQDTHATYCGTAPSTSCDSIVLASDFYSALASLSLDASTAYIRFSIQPQTPDTFDIIDTWVIPFNY